MMHPNNTYSQQPMDYYQYQTNIGYYNTNTFMFEPMNTTAIPYSTCSGTYFHHNNQQYAPVMCSTSSSSSSSSSSSPPNSYIGSANGTADNSELVAIVSDLAVDEKRPVKELLMAGESTMTPMIMIATAAELASPAPQMQPPPKRQRSKQQQEAKATAKRIKLEMRERKADVSVDAFDERDCDDVYAEHLFRVTNIRIDYF